VVVDLPPGDERLVQSAIGAADAVVIPTRAVALSSRASCTRSHDPAKTPRGIVITAARLGTNDLQETIDWWKGENVRSGASCRARWDRSGPEARLYRDGLDEYAMCCAGSCGRADPEGAGPVGIIVA